MTAQLTDRQTDSVGWMGVGRGGSGLVEGMRMAGGVQVWEVRMQG